MRVLVIPEDSRRDKELLRPLVQALFQDVGWGRAKVRVCEDPVLGGVAEALKWERIQGILDQYSGMVDLFLLVIDRDGPENAGRRDSLNGLEQASRQVLRSGQALIGEHAIEELEVWILAGYELPPEWRWQDIRGERDPKERYFRAFATRRGLAVDAAGRSQLAEQAARNLQRIYSLCPEVQTLRNRLVALRRPAS
jgi:hypothetical protein